jgi:hypothetical protein
MDHIDQELARAMNVARQLTESWAQVFLKSGQTLWMKAASYEVFRFTSQDESTDEDGTYFPEITCEELVLFDEEGNVIENKMYLPFSNVAGVIIHSPIDIASSGIDTNDE